jgi:hypothetical protein
MSAIGQAATCAARWASSWAAVMTTIGACCPGVWRYTRASSQPSITGILMSSRITSGGDTAITSSAVRASREVDHETRSPISRELHLDLPTMKLHDAATDVEPQS